MKYVEKGSYQQIKRNEPKCLKNWIWTIKAVQGMWRILQEVNFEQLNLKFLSQDVLENFFSQIRSFGNNRNPSPKQFEKAFKALLICNITSKHSFGANCAEDNSGNSLALSQVMNLSDMIHEREASEEENIDTEQAAIPQDTSNEILIDPHKIINIISRDQNIVQCPTCIHNLNDAELLHFIKHATATLEIKFPEICCELKVTEKAQKILEEQHLSILSQCTHLKTTLFTVITHEFIKTWCTFMNNLLCKKITTDSDNYMYKAATRMSTKYMRKISEKSVKIQK